MSLLKPMRTLTAVFSALLILISLQSAHAAQNGESAANPLEGIPAGEYNVDLGHASVVWKVSHFGFSTYVGRFTEFTADLNLDSADFSKSSVAVTIDINSISTEYPWPEKENFNEVLATEWFQSGDNASITFNSTSVSDLNGNKATVIGDLTMLGQTHPVTLDVSLNKATAKHPFKKVPVVGFSATTTIDRTVWGLDKYAPGIGAQVSVEIEGEFIKAQ